MLSTAAGEEEEEEESSTLPSEAQKTESNANTLGVSILFFLLL